MTSIIEIECQQKMKGLQRVENLLEILLDQNILQKGFKWSNPIQEHLDSDTSEAIWNRCVLTQFHFDFHRDFIRAGGYASDFTPSHEIIPTSWLEQLLDLEDYDLLARYLIRLESEGPDLLARKPLPVDFFLNKKLVRMRYCEKIAEYGFELASEAIKGYPDIESHIRLERDNFSQDLSLAFKTLDMADEKARDFYPPEVLAPVVVLRKAEELRRRLEEGN